MAILPTEVRQEKTPKHFDDLDPTARKLYQNPSKSRVPLSSTHRFKPTITLRTATPVLWHSPFELELLTNDSHRGMATGNKVANSKHKYKPNENSL